MKPPHDEATTEVAESRIPKWRPARAWRLEVVSGPGLGRVFEIPADAPQPLLLGQGPVCQVHIEDRSVSRRHASLEPGPTTLRFQDLGSTNGSSVNGLDVFDVRLRGGELIRVGATTLRVQAGEASQIVEAPVNRFGSFVGASPQMRALYPLCARLATADIPLVIEGETGTGKEVLAESIHGASSRASQTLVVFDCTTVPPGLAEGLLFGYEKGAFTGATEQKPGYFEQAHGGTLFIDEIGDLDLGLQAKLLRAIERGQVRRLGASRWHQFDVRIIAATRRDLDAQVSRGLFRDDLYFRLAVGRVELPPLRKRTGDIRVLGTHFWQILGGKPEQPNEEFLGKLETRTWPGNVRELKNYIARAIALGDLDVASCDAPESLDPCAGDVFTDVLQRDLPFPVARRMVLEAFEVRYVERVLERFDGHVGNAAKASGIGRRYFQMVRGRAMR